MRFLLLITASFCSFSAFCSLHTESGGALRLDVDTTQVLSAGNYGRTGWQDSDRLCWYNNQRYSEGAVINAGPVLMQCGRDRNVTGTMPLIWKPLNR